MQISGPNCSTLSRSSVIASSIFAKPSKLMFTGAAEPPPMIFGANISTSLSIRRRSSMAPFKLPSTLEEDGADLALAQLPHGERQVHLRAVPAGEDRDAARFQRGTPLCGRLCAREQDRRLTILLREHAGAQRDSQAASPRRSVPAAQPVRRRARSAAGRRR